MTIKPDVRVEVIEMAREGKGRNEIAHELGPVNTSGSVSNILRAALTPTSALTPTAAPTPAPDTITPTPGGS